MLRSASLGWPRYIYIYIYLYIYTKKERERERVQGPQLEDACKRKER